MVCPLKNRIEGLGNKVCEDIIVKNAYLSFRETGDLVSSYVFVDYNIFQPNEITKVFAGILSMVTSFSFVWYMSLMT